MFKNFIWCCLTGLIVGALAAQPVYAQRFVGKSLRNVFRKPQISVRIKNEISRKVFLHSLEDKAVRQRVFCAHARRQGGYPFSGGTFQVTHKGKKEIFGFIAAHSLAEFPSGSIAAIDAEYALNRVFELEVFDKKGHSHIIPAEVVQLSSSRMLDIALVKFRPEDEKLFEPFTLRREPLAENEPLGFYGFSDGGEFFLRRTLVGQTPLSLRTDMPCPRDNRAGFCGGAVFDQQGRLAGVHTGSNRAANPKDDLGFATHAKFLNVLVDAYHHKGKATFPLELDGKKMIDLAPNEYVGMMNFFDKNKEKVGTLTVPYKFSYSALKRMIETRHPRYIQFHIGQISWSADDPVYVKESPLTRVVSYDLNEGRVLRKNLEE